MLDFPISDVGTLVWQASTRLRCSDSGDLFQQKKGETPYHQPTKTNNGHRLPGKTKKTPGNFLDSLDAQSAWPLCRLHSLQASAMSLLGLGAVWTYPPCAAFWAIFFICKNRTVATTAGKLYDLDYHSNMSVRRGCGTILKVYWNLIRHFKNGRKLLFSFCFPSWKEGPLGPFPMEGKQICARVETSDNVDGHPTLS